MKSIKVFKTCDGETFENEKEAKKHEEQVQLVEKLIREVFPKKYDTCDFANHGNYIQLSAEQVKKLCDCFIAAIKKYGNKECYELAVTNPRGFVGRYLDDNGSPLYRLWGFLTRIDGKNRLYGQPYYCYHPSPEAKQIEVKRS